MNKTMKIISTACLLGFAYAQTANAQDYNTPLSMQGLNHTTDPSVASRALGGITITLKNDVSLMFSNPAALQSLEGIQISIAGLQRYGKSEQSQQWYPSANYSMLSLVMAGLTDTSIVPNPDTASPSYQDPNNRGYSALDTVPRAFDSIGPDWKHSRNDPLPLQFFAAMPFSFRGIKFTVGLGAAEYANLNRYYENNNVLSPDIGSYRAAVYYRPASDADANAIPVTWSQTISYRAGSIYGYGAAFSATLSDEIAVGLSGMLIRGTTYDKEYSIGRGVLVMHRTFFGLYPYGMYESKIGSSDYSGYEFTLSGLYQSRSVTLGLALKPPTTITRDYHLTQQIDTTGVLVTAPVSGSDKMELPWRVTFGLGLALRENVTLDFEYDYLPYASAQYSQNASTSKPWLDGYKFKTGLEFRPTPWLVLRTGYCKSTETFAPEGSYIGTDPVASYIYSGGIGLQYLGVQFAITYEYSKANYDDLWATNVNRNTVTVQNVILGISYTLKSL
jgi:opacity protein-like surface antigen